MLSPPMRLLAYEVYSATCLPSGEFSADSARSLGAHHVPPSARSLRQSNTSNVIFSIPTAKNRADLGGHALRVDATIENIVQISCVPGYGAAQACWISSYCTLLYIAVLCNSLILLCGQRRWPTDLTSKLDESEYMCAAREISDQLYGDASGTWVMDMVSSHSSQQQTNICPL
jgi:hypothetical protein